LRRRAAGFFGHRRHGRAGAGRGPGFRRTGYRRGGTRRRVLGARTRPRVDRRAVASSGSEGSLMAYALGVALFALAILISVSLHEAGHMATAKAFGMKVTRYFVGFGPTLWSFRRGETEYGVKAIP